MLSQPLSAVLKLHRLEENSLLCWRQQTISDEMFAGVQAGRIYAKSTLKQLGRSDSVFQSVKALTQQT